MYVENEQGEKFPLRATISRVPHHFNKHLFIYLR